jgi:hypothetical protein
MVSNLVDIAWEIIVRIGIDEDFENHPDFEAVLSEMNGEELIELGEQMECLGEMCLGEYNRRRPHEGEIA